MIPAKRLVYAVVSGLVIAIIYAIIPVIGSFTDSIDQDAYRHTILLIWIVAMGGFFVLALADLYLGFKERHIEIFRSLPNNLSIGAWINVKIHVRHEYQKPTTITIFDHYPDQTKTKFLPLNINLSPGKKSTRNYRLKPIKRGDIEFGRIQYRCPSPLKFWLFNRFSGEPASIKVYPDFAGIKKYILLGIDDRTSQLGIKLQQRRGEGLEFHRLRSYRREDSMRQIDWKASSRKRKLISREYQDERDQQIFFLLDCGRRMRSKDETLSHFDHALNAMLLLSYVALNQGDAVGLMSFSGVKNVWLNPLKGSGSINTILNTVYNLHACANDSDYSVAAETFFKRHKKRSLVVLVSNSRDENIDELATVLTLLKKRHLVLFANLREQVLEDIKEIPVTNFEEAISYSATIDFLQKRTECMKKLNHRNIITLDVTARQLPIAIVNAYHKIKRSGQL